MADIAINYIVNPFSAIFKGITTTFEIIGYSRAAAHLASLGYQEEAKNCMMEIAKLKK